MVASRGQPRRADLRGKSCRAPALIVVLDAFEANLQRMARFAKEYGAYHRSHANTHKTPAIAQLQVKAGAIGVRVEVRVGNRCGVPPGSAAVGLANQIATLPGLRFEGLQAYNGEAQHIHLHVERLVAAT